MSQTAPAPMYSLNESYRLVNKGDTPFKAMFNNIAYVIPVDGEAFVPFGAVDSWLGDPNARNIDETHRYRYEAHKFLLTKYGCHENPNDWEERKPKLEVYDLRGERVITIVDDPDGDHFRGTTQTQAESAVIEERMAMLERELSALRDAATTREAAVTSAEDFSEALENNEIEEDTPTQAGVGSRVPWKK